MMTKIPDNLWKLNGSENLVYCHENMYATFMVKLVKSGIPFHKK